MKKLLIVGAGAFGREVLSFVKHAQADWKMHGFLDANPHALRDYNIPYPILGDPNVYQPQEDECYLCAIGNTRGKLKLCRALQSRGAVFINFIHPAAWISDDITMGVGNIILPNVYIATNVQLGSFITCNFCSSIGHDAVVGDGCTLNSHCDVTGKVELGEGVFLGSHASVIPQKKIGDYAVVGAGSAVMNHVKPGITVVGVPARKLM